MSFKEKFKKIFKKKENQDSKNQSQPVIKEDPEIKLEKIENEDWIGYQDIGIQNAIDPDKTGKWTVFFKEPEKAKNICKTAVESGVTTLAKYNKGKNGACCFNAQYDDIEAHRRIIDFMIKNELIPKSENNKYFNISFRTDEETEENPNGKDFPEKIKLSNFINLRTGEWIYNKL